MTAPRRHLGTLTVLLALLGAAVAGVARPTSSADATTGDLNGAQDGGAPGRQAEEDPRPLEEPRVEDLTPWVAAAGEYAVRVRLPARHPGGRLVARVFRLMDDGAAVREVEDPSRRYRWATYELPIEEGSEAVTLRIPFGEGEGERLYLDPGVYPVLLEVLPHEGQSWRAVTYLTHLPEVPPRTQVALVVPVGAPLHWTSQGVAVAPEDVERIGALATTLAAFPEVPVTLALEPGLAAALADTPDGAAVRAQLAAIGQRGAVLHAPYVDVAAGSWAGTPLDPYLVEQFAAGTTALTNLLGWPPDGASWLVDAGDSPALLNWLAARGVTRFLLTPHVPGGGLPGGQAPLRLEGITAPHRAFAAAALDAPFPATGGNPVLQANHLLAALGADVLAGSEAPMALLAPGPTGGDLATLTALLRALGEPGLFEPVPVTALPTTARNPVEVPQPTPAGLDVDELVGDLDRLGTRLESFAATVGPGDPALADLGRSLLVAGRIGVEHAERARYVSDLEAAVRQNLSGIELADGGALTITSHRARLPVTLRNTSGRSLEVAVAAESAELTMLGDPVRATLAPGAIEDLEIPFRVSRSGDFEVQVTVTTPDGAVVITSHLVALRSTAVSGVGIVLSVGALAFLGVWWARNLRRRRRKPRSVAVSSSSAPAARVGEPVP